MDKPRRDRDGEIFENDLTNDEGIDPGVREPASHTEHLDPGINSQEDDADQPKFARELRKHDGQPGKSDRPHE